MDPLRSRTSASFNRCSCHAFDDAGHVAVGLPGHGGSFQLSRSCPSLLRDMASPSHREERLALEELIRGSASEQIDAAKVALALLVEFGSFASVIAGSAARLRRAGADDTIIAALSWCRSAIALSLRGAVLDRPVIGTSSGLLDYLMLRMGCDTRERVRILYLNARNMLLADEESSAGTVDAAPFYNREIVGRSIELGATSIIVAHNHPSGDPQPSAEDIRSTRRLSTLCSQLGIDLVDHVIVSRNRMVSMRAAGHLKP